ncbi:Dynein axonemal heavy chain 6 (Axonemal beta dynein heavy chain 6) (Ciliary dynein heavy chain 6) [Durusdinium trenchii]|uniref:Dynein axonemal heavy chain 6 (Axonemal beta dynein heavy chain 6) (Ciliary dynein heavy chain 6) n=1 Tax=Durusdinium trenchii TaxID=1381693 RepID=A0ABP0RGS5_9DINO
MKRVFEQISAAEFGPAFELRLSGLDGHDFRCRVQDCMTGIELMDLLSEQLPHKEGAVLMLVLQDKEICPKKTLREQGITEMSSLSYLYKSINLPRVSLPDNLKSLTFGHAFNESLDDIDLPNDLETLTFGEHFNHPMEKVLLPCKLKRLTFGRCFNNCLENVRLPANLRTLTFGDRFNERLDGVVLPNALEELSFGLFFNRSLQNVSLPKNLQSLTLGEAFNQSLESIHFPSNLKSLRFGEDFNQPLTAELPRALEVLIFGDRFNQRLEGVSLPEGLEVLTFGDDFVQSLESVSLPRSLRSLTFGMYLNHSLENVTLPQGLQELQFNQSLENVILPRSLHSLTFGDDFNQSVLDMNWPSGILTLTFGHDFDHSLEGVSLPQNLQALTFGVSFNQSMDDLVLPTALQALTFGADFNRPLDRLSLPERLESLTFGQGFNQPLDRAKLPSGLLCLTFGFYFNQKMDGVCLPLGLRSLALGDSFDQAFELTSRLPHLETLTFGDAFNQRIEALPSSLQNLTFGDDFDQPIEHLLLPYLQRLSFGHCFDQLLGDRLELRSLTIGDSFKQSFEGQSFPKLRELSIGTNCSLDGALLPSLRSLQFGPVAARCEDPKEGQKKEQHPETEVDAVHQSYGPRAKECGQSEAKDAVWQFFVESVRENLHIVLTMSPVGSALRVRMRMFPALVNCCTIDWFLPWPDEALLGVSARQLSGMQGISDEVRDSVAKACCFVHQEVIRTSAIFEDRLRRKVYVTPKSYLDLISLYLEMIQEKKDEKDVSLKRLQTGVDKIDEANSFVNNLQEELTKLAPVIAEKIKEADELVPVVTEEQKKAEVIKEKVSSEEATGMRSPMTMVVVRKQADEVKAIADDAQKDLDIAMPALESALKSLDSLDKKDIQEIKSFAKPPPLVMMTMEAVNVLLQEKPDWDTAKKVLNRSTFLQDLKTFDKDNIPEKVLKQLTKYVTKPEYTVEAVGNQSKAAKSLCMWTYAMDTYSKVAKEVEPKKQKVAELNEKLAKANAELQAKQDNLRDVEAQVAALQKKLNDTISEKDRLVAESQLTKERLGRADILTVGLKDEGVRWRETVSTIRQDIINLTGDVFLSAASISYYGPFTGVYRNDIVDAWLKELKNLQIPSGDSFDLREVMGNPVEIREWNLQGLPADAVSINNGVMVMRGKRWPLMIDPQSQGNKWIKKKEGKDLKTLKMTNPKMLLILEGCIRTGAPMLMEDIEETLDPALEPVLLKAVYEDNNRLQIKLGDSEALWLSHACSGDCSLKPNFSSQVDYDKNFLFYMTTKMPNPHYFPEVCIKVTVINFTVTFEGLEEQLLNEVVSKEIPETLQRRVELMLQLADDKKVLKQLEDKILKLLSESSGNILDDQVLISTLGESKETSTAVNQRVKAAEEAAVEIDAACKQYTEVATRGSILYFVIADLANINPMYQFSLFYFVRLFKNCMDKAAKSDDIDIRMTNLSNQILNGIFQNVCRGLFEDNKLTCSFLIATALQRHAGEISPTEWSLLLRGVGLLDMSAKPPNPDTDFFTDKMWDFALCTARCQQVYAIQQYSFDRCPDLCEHITENLEDWKDWVRTPGRITSSLVDTNENSQLHYFHYLLLLKGLAQEKLLVAIQEHTRRCLGEDFIIFPTATVAELYADSTRSTPIVFVLSTGADPTSMLLRFAQEVDMASTMGVISLGQGQGPKAKTMVVEARKKGTWVLLQNCHLYKTFMPELEKMCEELEEPSMTHKDFRLFLTSMPAAYFPVPVLQNGIKLTTEPPKGLRANVMRSFLPMSDEQLNDSAKTKEWRRLQFGLKFFHAVIQERRKFGPLGWNIRYEFNDSDLETSTTITHNMLELDGAIPWDTLLFVIGHINYGGRVTDDNDRKCLLAILEKYVTPKILEPDYKFSDSGTYRCPDNSDVADIEQFRKFVASFPITEQPEVFGMHDNANISFMSQEAEKVLSVVLSIQPREAGGSGGKSSEEMVLEIASDQELRLPDKLSTENAHADSFAMSEETGLMTSLGTCLSQEMSRFNRLLSQMSLTLKQLQKVMTGELDDMFNAELNNLVPGIWTKDGIGDWIDGGIPIAYWISSFYFPQAMVEGFLTSVLQGYSRSNMIPVDQRLSDKQMTDGLGMFGVCGWFTMQAATMFNVLLCKLQWEIL